MNLKVFTVPLDIKQPTSASDEWVVVAGDNGNEIHVVLTDDGEPVDLSGKTILAIFSKPDGSTSEQDSWGNGITVSGEDNNVVVIDLWPSSFGTGRLHIGLVKCEIQVYYGDSLENLVTSANFTFKVRRAILNNETVEQTSEYPILSELIRQVTEIGQGIQSDWNVDDPTQSGYIKNKPFIPKTAEDVGALPETTTPADIGALPETTTPADIGAIPTSQKGSANGVATLDANGKVTAQQACSAVVQHRNQTAITISADDVGKFHSVIFDSGSGTCTVTLPADLPVGSELEIYKENTNATLIITHADGCTLRTKDTPNPGTLTISERYGIAAVKFLLESIWYVTGDVE